MKNLRVLPVAERLAVQSMLMPSGCIEWLGTKDNKGYGHTTFRGRVWLAHRVAYTIHVGEIPDGLELDHLCRNRSCINPVHLEAVTHKVNSLRGESPFAINARKTECLRGHPFTPENTMASRKNARRCRDCFLERQTRYRQAKRDTR